MHSALEDYAISVSEFSVSTREQLCNERARTVLYHVTRDRVTQHLRTRRRRTRRNQRPGVQIWRQKSGTHKKARDEHSQFDRTTVIDSLVLAPKTCRMAPYG